MVHDWARDLSQLTRRQLQSGGEVCELTLGW